MGRVYVMIVILMINNSIALSQISFYSEIIIGGVTGAGFSTGLGAGQGNIDLYIEPGSSIKKAFLFTYSMGFPIPSQININNFIINYDSTKKVAEFKNLIHPNATPVRVYCEDITNIISPNITTYSITIPPIFNQPINWGYWTAFMLIIYENNSMNRTSIDVFLNNIDFQGHEIYNLNTTFKIDTNYPVGLSIYADRYDDMISAGTTSKLNNYNIGILNGSDANSNFFASGIKGHFYYQNNSLYGIDDDTPDNIFGSNIGDALADISTYLGLGQNINLELTHNQFPNFDPTKSHKHLAFFLAYTSPCDTFSVSHTPDTTICHGVPFQLQINGGQAYEWSPQVGLSCYDCPNPIFTSDSSILYSVRVWNNDSCSKVFPLRIRVKEPLPSFNFAIQPSECGDSTGSVIITPILNGFSYINQTNQDTNTTGVFNALSSGNYSFSILNKDNCPFDTLIYVPETLSVNASFTSNPNAGVSPLHVVFNNTSTNANSFQWIYENQTSNQENVSYTFQQDGIYPIMLIAYGNSQLCADTAYDTIYVYLPIEVEIPNIFTPNSDQNNDQWGIKINVAAVVDLQIFNRWGEIIVNRKEEVLSPGFIPLWDGGKHSGGVYYYVIRVLTDFEKKLLRGNVSLVK